MREAAETLPLGELMRAAVEQSGLLTYYEEKKEQERAEHLRELVSAATQFEEEADGNNEEILLEFLATAALASDDADTGESMAAVGLMTVHAAKGLEFNRVFWWGWKKDYSRTNKVPPKKKMWKKSGGCCMLR